MVIHMRRQQSKNVIEEAVEPFCLSKQLSERMHVRTNGHHLKQLILHTSDVKLTEG